MGNRSHKHRDSEEERDSDDLLKEHKERRDAIRSSWSEEETARRRTFWSTKSLVLHVRKMVLLDIHESHRNLLRQRERNKLKNKKDT
jgi:hypothetical protein